MIRTWGSPFTMIAIDLDPGTEIGAVRAELDTLAGSESLSVDSGDSVVGLQPFGERSPRRPVGSGCLRSPPASPE